MPRRGLGPHFLLGLRDVMGVFHVLAGVVVFCAALSGVHCYGCYHALLDYTFVVTVCIVFLLWLLCYFLVSLLSFLGGAKRRKILDDFLYHVHLRVDFFSTC